MLEKVEMGEKSNSHNTIIEEKKNTIYKLLVENVFSKRSRSKQKKTQKQNTANQIAPEISLKLFKVKVLQVFLFVPQKHLRPVNMCRL